MALLKQIDEKGAVLAWSPKFEYPNLIALGTKVDIKLFFLLSHVLNRILRALDLMTTEVNWSSINLILLMLSIPKLRCSDLFAPGTLLQCEIEIRFINFVVLGFLRSPGPKWQIFQMSIPMGLLQVV